MTTSEREFQLLLSIALNEGTPEDIASARARVEASPDLQASLLRLRAVLGAMRSDDTTMPSREVIERARQLAGAASPRDASILGAVRTLIASLVYDSRVAPALAGFRGAGHSPRHMVYRCEAGQLDLSVTGPHSPAQAWNVRGQFEGAREDSCVTVLAHPRDGGADGEASAPAGGDFVLALSSGQYDLDIRVGETVFRVECLDLK